MTKQTYRVSVYTKRGTHLIGDASYTSRRLARISFHVVAGAWINNSDACVMLTRGDAVLAAKHTDTDHVTCNRAYYS